MIRRIFVEGKDSHGAKSLLEDIRGGLSPKNLKSLRILQRYDVEGLDSRQFEAVKNLVFCEAPVENLYEEDFPRSDADTVFAVEYLPGQFDQRADSAEQCVQIAALTRPKVACARVYVLEGALTASEIDAVKKYLINPVDSREASMEKPKTLSREAKPPAAVARVRGFPGMDEAALEKFRAEAGLAMSLDDLAFCRDYFKNTEKRDPTVAEIRVLDTYWSDHCRHTTFLTRLEKVEIDDGPYNVPARRAWKNYLETRSKRGADAKGRICLMDLALAGARALKAEGKLGDLEESEEINAASVAADVDVDGEKQQWLVMFKNETHNHPTEIEPFGGAATCLGGAIRDPLSGRSYVYQAMRVTGAADPRVPFERTLPGKLPQKKIVTDAANGYSSYGNQIGLATGLVREIYHPGYAAKRLEIGTVVGAAPRSAVRRATPEKGDFVLLVGGRTGRDGIGGATGSSKDHDEKALENSAEVQKGDAPMERKLQRLFRNPDAARMVKRCNDFGAGGVSVAVGELAPSLEIDLDAVPKKYEGLDGTELAISESQERMAVVVSPGDAAQFARLAAVENLECAKVAEVKDHGRLVMKWRGEAVVDLSRAFLDTNGAEATASARISEPAPDSPLGRKSGKRASDAEAWKGALSTLNTCSQRGLVERFDSSVGAGTVLHPYGGRRMATPEQAMCAKIPLVKGRTNCATLFSFGFNPDVSLWSPYHGAQFAVLESAAKIAACGGDVSKIKFTFQEYFEKPRSDPKRWGKPLAALLGAFDAQMGLGCAAVGGKDSMSGSFKDMDVPPTLVSFAMCLCDSRKVSGCEFKGAGNKIVLGGPGLTRYLTPDWEKAVRMYGALGRAVADGEILSARVVEFGGAAEAVAKMAFGNAIGAELRDPKTDLFSLDCGAVVAELRRGAEPPEGFETIGETIEQPEIRVSGKSIITLSELEEAWEAPLEKIFPTRAESAEGCGLPAPSFVNKNILLSPHKFAKPTVFIPVFPGTNCEYDTARAFEAAGAEVSTFVFRNMSDSDVAESISEMKRRIDSAQILALPGGFSAGDEPAGSGKFIAAVFRNSALSDSVMSLLKDRRGLILGICNGFQALIKLGLVPFGEIRELSADSPTLTYNNIARHVSAYVRTRVVSTLSPWMSECSVGDEHVVPVSHGEGRFTAPPSLVLELARKGQIATQYVDGRGMPSADIPFNPNGSVFAVEGVSSPCGLVLGKMGHSERFGDDVGKNIYGNKVQPVFSAGVKYFR